MNKDDDDDENNNCKVNSELFNNYFLTTAERISCHFLNNIKVECKNNKHPTHYLPQIVKHSFPKQNSIKQLKILLTRYSRNLHMDMTKY